MSFFVFFKNWFYPYWWHFWKAKCKEPIGSYCVNTNWVQVHQLCPIVPSICNPSQYKVPSPSSNLRCGLTHQLEQRKCNVQVHVLIFQWKVRSGRTSLFVRIDFDLFPKNHFHDAQVHSCHNTILWCHLFKTVWDARCNYNQRKPQTPSVHLVRYSIVGIGIVLEYNFIVEGLNFRRYWTSF